MITSHRNRGAAFGILQGQRTFFIIITIVILIALIWFIISLTREGKRLFPIALSFIFGGAIGNFIDRLRMGEVVDFFHFHFKFSLFGLEIDYHYPIFNVADSAIVCGVILILIDTVLNWRNERNERKGGWQSNESGSAYNE